MNDQFGSDDGGKQRSACQEMCVQCTKQRGMQFLQNLPSIASQHAMHSRLSKDAAKELVTRIRGHTSMIAKQEQGAGCGNKSEEDTLETRPILSKSNTVFNKRELHNEAQ